jgi:hypothetical protein
MGPMCFPSRSLNNYHSTLRNTSEEWSHLHCGRSLKSRQQCVENNTIYTINVCLCFRVIAFTWSHTAFYAISQYICQFQMPISFVGLCDDSQYGKLILILAVSTALECLTILKLWGKCNWFVFCRYTLRSWPSDTRHAAPLPARGCKEGKTNENSSSKVSSNSYKQYVNTMCLSIRQHGHSVQVLPLRVFCFKNEKINCPCSHQEYSSSSHC